MKDGLEVSGRWLLILGLPVTALGRSLLDLPFGAELPVFALIWAEAILLLAASHVRRFGGTIRDWLWMGGAMALLVVLPFAPLLPVDRPPEGAALLALLGASFLGVMVAESLRGQGRYALTRRDLPELQGAARRHAEEVLERAGLEATSVRVAPFESFNAAVQGFRKCTVVVDRRASEALSPRELSAILAHEAGHIRLGGVLPYGAAIAVVLAAGAALSIVGWTPGRSRGTWAGGPHEIGLGQLLAATLVALRLSSHWIELRCDRFAARLTSPDDIAVALDRIHEDMPPRLSRWVGSALFAPFLSHPPLAVRRAALRGVRRGPVLAHWAICGLVWVGLVGLPISFSLAATARGWRPLPALVDGLAVACPWAYLGASNLILGLIGWEARREKARGLALKGMKRALAVVTLALWASSLIGLLAVRVSPMTQEVMSEAAMPLLALFGAAMLTTIVALKCGVFRRGTVILSNRAKAVLQEASAALTEGKTAEALQVLQGALAKRPKQPWLRLLEGRCLLQLGRLEEAEAALAIPLREPLTEASAKLLLAVVEMHRGNLQRAEELARAVVGAPGQGTAVAWYVLAATLRAAGRHADAEAALARSCELDGRLTPALALRVECALERGAAPGDVEAWLEDARRQDPRRPQVLRASARWRLARDEVDEARRDILEAVAELDRRGDPADAHAYRLKAREWGLLEEEPPAGAPAPR